MSFLDVSGISRKEQGNYIVKDVSFNQKKFKKIAIAGATGSGKTTLLKMIAGLIQLNAGTILFEDERVKGPEELLLPGHQGIAYLSQYFELSNHYRVEEVLAMANQLMAEEAALIYDICRISDFLKRGTHQLSGGEKQRIALATLLVSKPRLLLLDEPYSNLDMLHKNILKKVIRDVGKQLGITSILVSHDPLDTLSWANAIFILNNGQLIQQGTPDEVYRQPVNEYAAALFGKYNLISPVLAKTFAAFVNMEEKINRFIRPENFKLVKEGEGVRGKVSKVSFMGSYFETAIRIGETTIIVTTDQRKITKGDTVYVSLQLDD